MVLQISDKLMSMRTERRTAMNSAAERRPFARINIRPPHTSRNVFERAEVLVVAGALAGKQTVQRVVNIIAPLSVETKTTEIRWTNDARIVQVTLGNQHEMAS